jgi:hypothetical protein
MAGPNSFVIASEAKQSRVVAREALDCRVASLLAMTSVVMKGAAL